MEIPNISTTPVFNTHQVLHRLKHFLPQQAPLKDFIHHNVLPSFQHLPFHQATFHASKIFGYKTYLTLQEYRQLYTHQQIQEHILDKIIIQHKGKENLSYWKNKLLYEQYEIYFSGRTGRLMHLWKDLYKVNITKYIQPTLFRIISAYLDQGIALVEFPFNQDGLLNNIRYIETHSAISYFFSKTSRARKWLIHNEHLEISYLLSLLVGNEEWFEDYLFDLCFEHPGWSGIVAILEDHPEYLLKPQKITLEEFIILELLFQIDYLDKKLVHWKPLHTFNAFPDQHILESPKKEETFEILQLWQEAYEWSYYEHILAALQQNYTRSARTSTHTNRPSFQSIHCLDDRSESIRRYIEIQDPHCETFGTAGFFNMDFYFQPEHSHFHIKLAPAPSAPKHLIIEKNTTPNLDQDFNLHPQSHALFRGWLLSQTMGYWAALKLAIHLFHPHDNPASVSAHKHSNPSAQLICEPSDKNDKIQNLYRGFSKQEAADKLEILLKSIGLTKNFAPLVYIIGHGAGSTNNPYYAAYDCGACAGKPGSVNARVVCYFLNNKTIRELLKNKDIHIPEDTYFIPGLHDTTSDQFCFYDINQLPNTHKYQHQHHLSIFTQALHLNAKERARRFVTINIRQPAKKVHEKIKLREFALFEPRPEYNHATNALCIIGRRQISKNLFLDRRAFLNSYNYQQDKEGVYLLHILKPIAAVCGGINLEYYFSRVDNQKLGAGSKLPHNVYGLIGVANGAEGDLRTALPQQMIEIHDPVRLLLIIEHYPEIIKKVLESSHETKEWFYNQWIHLVALHPDENNCYYYNKGLFEPLHINNTQTYPSYTISELQKLFEQTHENMPVCFIHS